MCVCWLVWLVACLLACLFACLFFWLFGIVLVCFDLFCSVLFLFWFVLVCLFICFGRGRAGSWILIGSRSRIEANSSLGGYRLMENIGRCCFHIPNLLFQTEPPFGNLGKPSIPVDGSSGGLRLKNHQLDGSATCLLNLPGGLRWKQWALARQTCLESYSRVFDGAFGWETDGVTLGTGAVWDAWKRMWVRSCSV